MIQNLLTQRAIQRAINAEAALAVAHAALETARRNTQQLERAYADIARIVSIDRDGAIVKLTCVRNGKVTVIPMYGVSGYNETTWREELLG